MEANLAEGFDLSGLLDEYRDEARGQLDQLDAALLKLEREGTLPEPERTALLRALHTLKGNSGMLGYAAIRDFVHAAEAVFREPPAAWPQPLLDRLFEGAAALRRAVERVGTADEAAALERLRQLLPLPSLPSEVPAAEAPAGPDTVAGGDEAAALGAATDVLRVPFAKLDALMNRVGDVFGIHAALDDLIERHRAALQAAGVWPELRERVELLERVADELRAAALELRLVPIGRVFGRFPSLARELAREQGKQVRVVLEGEDTELDKSTVDALAEPLLHLVRNAVDHGLGTPDERRAGGKPPEGTLLLRAVQAGDRVRVEVEDDGRGLDRERILRRAREAGLLAPGEEPDDEEIAALIFRPGFSTRHEADTVSGRGIGLDVVASSVARLRGGLAVEDVPGRGTRFVLELPLTLAIVPALLFEAGGELLALPALEVEETLRPGRPDRVAGAEVVRHGDALVPLARPARLFGWADDADAEVSGGAIRFAVIVRRGSRSAAVAADRLLEQRDVVVKALPAYLGQPPGVSGATIAPDGRVVLVLDPGGLIDLNLESHRRLRRAP